MKTGMLRFLAVCGALLIAVPAVSAETISIDPDDVLHEVSPSLYGIFIEDINCAVDGGLYAELIKNRSFENENLWHPQKADHWDAWSVKKTEKARTSLENEQPLHENNPTFLRAALEEGGFVRLANQGFGGNLLRGGIPLSEEEGYDLSFWARWDQAAAESGTVTVSLTDVTGRSLCVEPLEIPLAGREGPGHWVKFGAVLTARETGGAVLSVSVSGRGTVDLDMFSCMPRSRTGAHWPGGGMRTDLVEALQALRPAFLRFPGGCVAEGTYVRENAYEWKQTVGPAETRREIPNTWGGMQTMGVGFFEYFCLAEELGALPVPVVHAGVLCQARDVKDPPLTLEQTKAYVQDVLDLIEFAAGGTESVWGGLRAEMGHPAPFDLRYIAIGNENWGETYFTRYQIIRDAVKEKYPEMTCIVAAGPVAEGGLFNDSWNSIRRRFPDDLADEHYYMESSWFPGHVNRYDRYPRGTKVFLGEYAAHEPVQGSRRPNNLYAALCEAAYLTGIERNSDVVVMSCYAPLLAREGEADWTPDLIWFSDSAVYKTPSWYVQQLFASARGDELVKSTADGGLFHSATRTDNEVQVKLVNLSDRPVPLTVLLAGAPDQTAPCELLTGEKNHVNSFARPDKIVPRPAECVFSDGQAETEMPPYSLLVIRVRLTDSVSPLRPEDLLP